MNNLKPEEPALLRNGTFEDMAGLSAPQSVDWRQSGLVSPVQNQVSYFKGGRKFITRNDKTK